MLFKILILTSFANLCYGGYETKTLGLGAYATHTIANYAHKPGRLPQLPTNRVKFPQQGYYPSHIPQDYNYPGTPSQYQYGYKIEDPISGDTKTMQETRNGDMVQGMYSLIDADGTKRTVTYTADPKNGFNAVVTKEPIYY